MNPSNQYVLSYTPTLIYSAPPAGVQNTVTIQNNGAFPVYVGGSNVTQTNGLVLPVGGRPVKLLNQVTALYGVCTVSQGNLINTVGTTTTATNIITPSNAKSTVTTTAGYGATLLPGTVFGIGNTVNSSNLEYATVASSVLTGATAITAPLLFPHVGGEGIYAATTQLAQVQVTIGLGTPYGVQTQVA